MQSGMVVVSRELDECFKKGESLNSWAFIEAVSRYVTINSAEISQQWQFPEAVTNALDELIECNDPKDKSLLARITFFSDKLIKLNVLKENGHTMIFDDDLSNVVTEDMYGFYLRCQRGV